jgi:cysteinyl-tRNA synthetase
MGNNTPTMSTTQLSLYNTLTRQLEPFQPTNPPHVSMYACGFTVYDFTHLGHLRKYTMDDILVRTLRRFGYQVNFVQNVTDVGHLVSDADTGEDKLEKGARKYGKTVWEVAREFEDYFWRSMDLMGNLRPDTSCRATEHIEQQIELVKELEQKGYAYLINNDGIYFDTAKFADYGELAMLDLEKLKEGARVEPVAGKRNPTDFALWKFERPGENRAMVWESPWHPRGFPGWHIECSAMAMNYLGQQLDIHTGGIDHIPVHHTNEIAQSEAATGKKPFVKYWVHHNHLFIEGEKMSKSLGNFFTIDDVIERGFSPRALRLLFLTTHYQKEMNFTWDALSGMQKSYKRLLETVVQFRLERDRTVLSQDKLEKVDDFRQRFLQALANNLNTPEAVAVMWEVVKSNIPGPDKYDLLMDFDEVLALDLRRADQQLEELAGAASKAVDLESVPDEVRQLVEQRRQAREQKDWQAADQLRQQLGELGYSIKDMPDGSQQVYR